MNRLLTPKEAAEICGMSKWWISEQIRKGKIRAIYFGNRRRIRSEEFIQFVSTLPSVNPEYLEQVKLYVVGSKR